MTVVRTTFDALTRGWLWIGLILTPILAHAGGMGFQAFAFFLGCGGLLVAAVNWKDAAYLRQLWLPLFLCFTIWAWFSSVWSPYEDDRVLNNGALLFGFALSLIFIPVVFMRLTETARRRLGHIVMAGTVLGAGLMLLDLMSGFALSTFVDPVSADSNIYVRQGEAERSVGRGLMTYTQLIWPVGLLMLTQLKRGWTLLAVVFFALIATAVLNRLSLTVLSLLLTSAFVAVTWFKPKVGLLLAFGIAIASLMFAPLIGIISSGIDEAALAQLPGSWEQRVRMWAYVWERIQEHWILGNGFDASRTYQDTFRVRDGREIAIVSLHPHNIGLQIWLETGLIGIVLAVSFLFAAIKPILRFCTDKTRAAAMTGVIIATTLNGALTIGVWQYWWWAVIALGACMVGFIPHKRQAVSSYV